MNLIHGLLFSAVVGFAYGIIGDLADLGLKVAEAAEAHDKHYVRVVNNLGPNVHATVDCASGDDRVDTMELDDGQGFAWDFKPDVLGRTLFWCDVRTSDGKSKHWDVYEGKERSQNWFMRGDGIYSGDTKGNGLLKKQDW